MTMNVCSPVSLDGNRDCWNPEELHEACGVFGLYARNTDVARLAFFGLFALQHRGQESAGIATCDGRIAYTHRGMGLVTQVFNEDNLGPLKGHMAIGHTRYSTTGSSHLRNAQPFLIDTMHGPLGVAHNGNLPCAQVLRQQMLRRGTGLMTSSDSEIIVQMLVPSANQNQGSPWEGSMREFMDQVEGSYALVVITREAVFGMRDPLGLRPLCIGYLGEPGHVVGHVIASESCALSTIGATYEREVKPGEIVRLDDSGYHCVYECVRIARRALCVFEYVYFARPDSIMDGRTVYAARQRMGEILWREAPVSADIVVGVPDSATSAAIGYAKASGIPFTEGLIKSRYIGRTFIQPNDQLRRTGVRLKFNPLADNIRGRRVVLVDDSIVRGNTIGPLVRMIKASGAVEVHVRIASPPVCHPCHMGVDMPNRDELIGSRLSVDGIREHVGANSLASLTHSGMMEAVEYGGIPGYCSACFTGNYPLRTDDCSAVSQELSVETSGTGVGFVRFEKP